MSEPSADEVEKLLRAAGSAESRGAAAIRRPAWYAVGLGVSTGLALASFAVPGLTMAGVVLGAILLPMVLEIQARRQTGGSPAKSYLQPPTRATAVAYAAGGAAVAAVSLAALKATGESWVVLPGALVLGVGTISAARRMDRLRARKHGTGLHRP